VVIGVVDGSPAAEAKVQEGGCLIELGAKPAKAFPLGEILKMLRRDGQTVVLKLQRGTQTVAVKLELRPVI